MGGCTSPQTDSESPVCPGRGARGDGQGLPRPGAGEADRTRHAPGGFAVSRVGESAPGPQAQEAGWPCPPGRDAPRAPCFALGHRTASPLPFLAFVADVCRQSYNENTKAIKTREGTKALGGRTLWWRHSASRQQGKASSGPCCAGRVWPRWAATGWGGCEPCRPEPPSPVRPIPRSLHRDWGGEHPHLSHHPAAARPPCPPQASAGNASWGHQDSSLKKAEDRPEKISSPVPYSDTETVLLRTRGTVALGKQPSRGGPVARTSQRGTIGGWPSVKAGFGRGWNGVCHANG